MKIPEDARLEMKFSAYSTKYHSLVQWVGLHGTGFYRPFPVRWVNNIYFDTFGCDAYARNVFGDTSRTKIRYRWYGKDIHPGKGCLEIKKKRNTLGWKTKFDVLSPPFADGSQWIDIKQSINEQILEDGRKWLKFSSFPIIINQYCRDYFISSDNKIRITIDTQQNVWDQRYKLSPNFSKKCFTPDTLVLEVKVNQKDYQLVSEITKTIPIRMSRHSKYINAVNLVSGNVD